MKGRTLLLGIGLLGATALSGGGTVYALNTLGLVPKVPETKDAAITVADGADRITPTPQAAPVAVESARWSYAGATGPDHWSEVDSANSICKTGGAQSPVDLTNALHVAALPGLEAQYATTHVKVTNDGHTFQVNVDKGSSVKIAGKRYDLQQFHFHTPSEHTIEGKAFPMEMQLVHQAADKSLAVVSILFAEGNANMVLGKFWDRLPRTSMELDSGVTLDLKDLLPRAMDDYFTYAGSLTTPPCTESVRWIVLEQPMQLSKAQIATFRSVFPANARPIQPLGARYVLSS